ncbi:hypothetical protein M7I_4750 [Glarea lozoyensis 74030]|uniref:Uncharacterized protein n=1 Tax=Glarea lozoyensis (strain ATCC 74030 / MF5533) TaxID=1104152 RepID=H0EQ09_GLAL7|nr:hypothetical protein M7I_4750 [Glarea lozoyensis 74030]
MPVLVQLSSYRQSGSNSDPKPRLHNTPSLTSIFSLTWLSARVVYTQFFE